MKKIFLLIVVLLFSCGKKSQNEINKTSNEYDTLKKNSSIDSLEVTNKKKEDFKIGKIYKDSDFNVVGIYVNYSNGKYKFEKEYPDFLIDSTITEEEKYQKILSLNNEKTNDQNVIKIRDFGLLNINHKGTLLTIFLKKEKADKWKVIDILDIGKTINMDEYQYKMEGNQYLSFDCYNSKHNQYFGVVIDKINSSGKYEKVLKAYKFDLINEKIVEIDLKKEKVECFPEIGDE
ncbi:hypothetical protein B0A67_10290 [Flavobacterium aquidurense]|jgi:hypothetical protein|uniref:hypothetical protein n=1 Tax=Flavobacterium aquidurense TaxID=362413 RepID=UPI000919B3DA|nr:hypothetical protein [Flavobacterium aquidurense]OXA71735.1 hypothetical protein B0A67_10290 [Flavobacterium aquidurense]SHH20952.1 hypothetical protein SAMN05444481_11358 [Flavobacterium frigidimaris]